MTTTPFPGTDDFDHVFAWAFLYTDDEDEVVCTHHLLRGMRRLPRVAEVLDAYDITASVIERMVRAEAPESGAVERLLTCTVKPTRFSSAAAAALDRAQAQPSLDGGAERTPVDLLLAMLGDSQCRAVGVLTECGADIVELRNALREELVPPRRERLPVDLRRTRDALVGRELYRPQGRGMIGWLRRFVLKMTNDDFGAEPVFWVRLEADRLAAARGRRMASDDVLLALLTTHEVALAYPHLVGNAQPRYSGGQALLAAGVDHDRVRAVMDSTDLGKDAVPLPAFGDWPKDTGQIIERLLCVPGNRSARLLAELGVTADLTPVPCWRS